MAIVRTARRLRQEAAGSGDGADADRRLGAGDGGAARAAHPERAGGDRAGQAADRHPHLAGAARGGPGRSRSRPRRRAQRPGQRQRRRPRAAAPPARPQERLSWRGACATCRRADVEALERAATILEQMLEGEQTVSAGLRRSFDSLAVPNYRRYFAGQIVSLSGNWMQMVAEVWLVLSLTGSGLAVGVTTALQFLPILLFGAWGGAARRPLPEARPADGDPGADGAAGAGAAGDRPGRRRRPLDGLRPRLRPRHGQRRRQPDPAELRDRDGRRPTASSTRSASTAC